MKKIKKLNVIEEGRICSPEELNKIRGGAYGYGCEFSGCNTWESCGLLGYETCKVVASKYGFESNDGSISCGSGYTYSSCNAGKVTTCSGNKAYTS